MDWLELPLGWAPKNISSPDKQEVALAALAPLCRSGTWLRRADLRRLIGRLCWFMQSGGLKSFMWLPHEATDGAAESGCRSSMHKIRDAGQ